MFDWYLDIVPLAPPMGFQYGSGCFGPPPENRRLDDIRPSLLDAQCDGPEVVYSIAMDVGRSQDRELLEQMHLLFGVVTFSAGRVGREPVRSQGHVHAISPLSNSSTPELYEIWQGSAVIYMQEFADDDPGRCFAIAAGPGEQVLVPPGWAHCTISADPSRPLTFGAWCVREYGFDYTGVRAHHGLAYFPVFSPDGGLDFLPNTAYRAAPLLRRQPRACHEFGIQAGRAVYRQFVECPDRFRFISRPDHFARQWEDFAP